MHCMQIGPRTCNPFNPVQELTLWCVYGRNPTMFGICPRWTTRWQVVSLTRLAWLIGGIGLARLHGICREGESSASLEVRHSLVWRSPRCKPRHGLGVAAPAAAARLLRAVRSRTAFHRVSVAVPLGAAADAWLRARDHIVRLLHADARGVLNAETTVVVTARCGGHGAGGGPRRCS
jgi:hypothetical protein